MGRSESLKKILIIGGYFDNSPDGYLGEITYHWSNDNSVERSEWKLLLHHHDEAKELLVDNKGFAGSCWHEGLLWTCLPNRVLALDPGDWSVVKVIDDELFNDLHNVWVNDHCIIVANTGLESIDEFDHEGRLKNRIFLNKIGKTMAKIRGAADFRTADSKPHYYHLNYVFKDFQSNYIITLFQQRRVINYNRLQWLTPLYDAPPHEGAYWPLFFSELMESSIETPMGLWTTTIDGGVQCIDIQTHKPIRTWNIPSLGGPKGWTRGLMVIKNGFFVGVTVVRESAAPYFHNWVDQNPEETATAVCFVNWKGEIHTTYLPKERCPKIFSILPRS